MIFTISTGIIKKLLNVTKKKKKKHDKTISLAKNRLDIIETLLSSALDDFEISQKEFVVIINEKTKNEEIKKNIKNVVNRDSNEENNKTTTL